MGVRPFLIWKSEVTHIVLSWLLGAFCGALLFVLIRRGGKKLALSGERLGKLEVFLGTLMFLIVATSWPLVVTLKYGIDLTYPNLLFLMNTLATPMLLEIIRQLRLTENGLRDR